MNASDFDRDSPLEVEMAAEELDAEDLAILEALRAHYAATDPVPDGLVDRIQFELTLESLHAEVATLIQFDLAGAGTRGATTESVRTITFTSDSLTTMVTLTPQPDGTVRLDGWAAPGGQIRVEILRADDVRETYTDDDGRFVFEHVPSGLAKFALHVPRDDDDFSTVLSPTIEL